MRVVLCDGAEKYRTRHEVCFHNSTRGTAGAMLLDEASPGAWLSMLSVALFVSVLNLYVLEHVRGRHGALASWRRVLLVISHPDDESMFFGPTIQALRRAGARTHILCLSNGDADGLGAVREKELESARKFLGVDSSEVVNDSKLKDGFKEVWPEGTVAAYVEASVRRLDANVVLTFDERGVSGHPNHVAAYRGVRRWAADVRKTSASPSPEAWALVTVNPLRKFLTFGDVFASFALESHVLVAATSAMEVRRAMSLHRSQWVWYRKLFVVFSRYAYVNSLRRL
jgi:N-acetylglucosaminylphosphatidylinositol deacetylase